MLICALIILTDYLCVVNPCLGCKHVINDY